MKILHVITNIKNCGPFRVLESIIDLNDNNEYSIASLFGQDDQKLVKGLQKKGIKVINLNLSKNKLFTNKQGAIKKIVDNNYDIIHSHGILSDYIVSKITTTPIVSTIHNNMYEDYIFNFGSFMGNIYCYWHKKILKKFNQVVCCSKSSYDVYFNKWHYNNLNYVRNGIDIVDYHQFDACRANIRSEYNINDDDCLFVYAGVISEGKAVVELSEMFAKYTTDNDYLFIIGDGPLKDKCIANDHIKLLGYKSNIYDYFAAADVYTSNSKSEGFSISVLEALMMNNLLLLSDIDSHKEMINMFDSYVGECFNDNNFKNSLMRLKNNINMKISSNILKSIDVINTQCKYKKIYNDLLKKRKLENYVKK